MEIGDQSMPYVTRYRLDLSVKATAAEIRIHADKDGKYKEALLKAEKICTDATVIRRNGKQEYIRNFSTEDCVLYCGSEKKDIEALKKFRIFQIFSGTLIHDHETAAIILGVHMGNVMCILRGTCGRTRKKQETSGVTVCAVSSME